MCKVRNYAVRHITYVQVQPDLDELLLQVAMRYVKHDGGLSLVETSLVWAFHIVLELLRVLPRDIRHRGHSAACNEQIQMFLVWAKLSVMCVHMLVGWHDGADLLQFGRYIFEFQSKLAGS